MADEKEETVVEETDETEEVESDEEAPESDAAAEDELDEKALGESKALYKLLKDPNTQMATIRAMAAGAGLLGKETPETKQEVKEAKRELLAVLKESLGPELEWLAVKLSPGLEKMLDQERKELKASLSTVEQTQVEQQTEQAWEKLHLETKGLSKQVEKRMIQLADEVYPAPNQSPLAYLRNLYKIASSDRTATVTRQNVADKINRNSKDAPGRLHSGSTSNVRSTPPAGNLSLKDAVQNALNNVGKGK